MKTKLWKTGLLVAAVLAIFGLLFSCGELIVDEGKVPGPDPTHTGLTISPETPNSFPGGTIQFTATVHGANGPDQTVIWSLDETQLVLVNEYDTTIDANGLLTISDTQPEGPFTVYCRSVGKPALVVPITVTIYPVGEVPVDAAIPWDTTQPVNATYVAGTRTNEVADLFVAATISDGGVPSYQWYTSPSPDPEDGGAEISGATEATYKPAIPAQVDATQDDFYYVVVTNTNDAATGAKTAAATSARARIRVTRRPDAPPATLITGKNLTSALNIPMYNLDSPIAMPADITADPSWGFTGSIQWYSSSNSISYSPATGSNFLGLYYRADITLEADAGFTFNGLAANSFTHDYAAQVEQSAGLDTTLFVQVYFQRAAHSSDVLVSITNLAACLAAPVRNETAQTTVSTAQYSGTVTWKTAAGTSHTGMFGAVTVYSATVALQAEAGFTLNGLTANSFSHSGSQDVSFDIKTAVVTIVFPATADVGQAAVVSAFNLTSLLPVPIHRSSTRTTSFSTDQYTAAVAWAYNDTGLAVSGASDHSRPFKAVVTLTEKEGFTFAGVPANAFAHALAMSQVQNDLNGNVVTVVLPGAQWVVGTLSYPQVGTAQTSGWQTTVQSCCWPIDSSNDRSGAVLVTSRNPGRSGTANAGANAPSSSGSTSTDIGTNVYYDYAWNGTTTDNRSSWQMFVGTSGTESWTSSTAYQNGWRGGYLNGDESGKGHPTPFMDNPDTWNVPEALRRPAHCFSLDLQSVRALATFGIWPRRSGTSAVDAGTREKWPIEIEIFYSSLPIGPTPDVNDPAQDVHSLGIIDIPEMTATPFWHDVKLYELTPDGKPLSARYFHFRIYAEQRNGRNGSWVCPSFTQIRFGVSN